MTLADLVYRWTSLLPFCLISFGRSCYPAPSALRACPVPGLANMVMLHRARRLLELPAMDFCRIITRILPPHPTSYITNG